MKTHTILIHSNNLQVAQHISQEITGDLTQYTTHFRITTQQHLNLKENIDKLRKKYQIDINVLPQNFNPKNFKAFVSDMDSTLINIECIDEIADFAGLKPQVASITEQAMRGKLDFNASLTQRVLLLKGLNTSVLQKVYDERLQINTGGEKLIQFLQTKNIKTAVVSGGFTFFTKQLQQKLQLDYQLANNLEEEHNILTGKTFGEVVNARKKAEFVENLAFDNSQIITCGDGANDLEMMKISGLSIAYHAKEKVNEYADIIIKFDGLDTIIDLFE